MGWNHQPATLFIAKYTCNFSDEYNQVIQVVTWTLSPEWRLQDRLGKCRLTTYTTVYSLPLDPKTMKNEGFKPLIYGL